MKTPIQEMIEFMKEKLKEDTIFALRPEQLSVQDFITLTLKMESDGISTQH